jgi:hypothetical protein
VGGGGALIDQNHTASAVRSCSADFPATNLLALYRIFKYVTNISCDGRHTLPALPLNCPEGYALALWQVILPGALACHF